MCTVRVHCPCVLLQVSDFDISQITARERQRNSCSESADAATAVNDAVRSFSEETTHAAGASEASTRRAMLHRAKSSKNLRNPVPYVDLNVAYQRYLSYCFEHDLAPDTMAAQSATFFGIQLQTRFPGIAAEPPVEKRSKRARK